jgi:hypothetical protein
MSATGLVLDAVLMLLLVAAIAFGIRLERKLSALRAGQAAFAGAVTELNSAAARAEAAMASLRAAGQETDLLHDRIVKARELKGELESLLAKAPKPLPPLHGQGRSAPADQVGAVPNGSHPASADAARPSAVPVKGPAVTDGDAAARMAALRERLGAARAHDGAPDPARVTSLADAIAALTRNASAAAPARSISPARRATDEDLFAA